MKQTSERKTFHLNINITRAESEQLDKICCGVYGGKTTLIRGLIKKFLREHSELVSTVQENGGTQ